jgi:hypothetical protein
MKLYIVRLSLLSILVFCGTVFSQTHFHPQDGLSVIEPLNSGETVEGSIPASTTANDCVLGATQYKIEIVAPDSHVSIVMTGNLKIDKLYVRLGSPVTIEDGKIVADFNKLSFLSPSDRLDLPVFGVAPLQPGTYFIAITNCSQVAAGYKLTATISGPPDAQIIDVLQVNSLVGSIPAPVPGNCELSRTQYTLVDGIVRCGGGTLWNVKINADQNVNVLIRKDKPVTVENGVFMYDRTSANQVKIHNINRFDGTGLVEKVFIAVLNCGYEPVNYTVSTSPGLIADAFPPGIRTAFFRKKDLHIAGFLFRRTTVTIDGQPQTAAIGWDQILGEILIIKKAKKNIAHGQTVRIVVTDSGGCNSSPFLFTRP